MAANNAPIFPLTIQQSAISILPADTTTEKTLVTGGTNGTRIDVISATSTDTSAVVCQAIINDGSTSYVVGEFTLAIGQGTDGSTKAKKVLNSSDLPWLDASGALFLKAGWKLNIKAKTTVTTAKALNLVAFSGDY